MGESEAAEERHAAYYLSFAEKAESNLMRVANGSWFQRVEVESDNLAAALYWCTAKPDRLEMEMRLVAALIWFWCIRGYVSQGRAWIDSALERSVSYDRHIGLRAKCLYGTGALAYTEGDTEMAHTQLADSLTLSQKIGDRLLIAQTRYLMGLALLGQGDSKGARLAYEESLVLIREAQDPWSEAFVLACLGHVTLMQGYWIGARSLYGESLARFRDLGNDFGRGMVLHGLGGLAQLQGRPASARRLYSDSASLIRESGDKCALSAALIGLAQAKLSSGSSAQARILFTESVIIARDTASQIRLAVSLAGLARVAAVRGEAEHAGRLFGATEALFPATGILMDGVFPTVGMLRDGSERPSFLRQVAAARRRLDPDAFASGWSAGASMSIAEVIESACERDESATP